MYDFREEELSCLLESLRSRLKEEDGKVVFIQNTETDFCLEQVQDILANAERNVDFLRFKLGQITETEYLNMWPIEHEYDPLEGYDYLDEEDEDE